MDLNVQTLLTALILAGIVWIARSVNEHGKLLSVLQTLLTGANGENGINSEVKTLRERSHDQGDMIHTLLSARDLHEQRIALIERRSDAPGRRAGDCE